MIEAQDLARQYGAEAAMTVLLLQHQSGSMQTAQLEYWLGKLHPDPGRWLEMIESNQLQHLLFKSGIADLMPAQVPGLHSLREQYSYRGKFNIVILEELRRVSLLIGNAGIDVLYYKGLVLGHMLYGDLSTRITSDIDILIHDQDLAVLRKILQDAGFEEMYAFPPDYEGYLKKANREAMFRKRAANGQYVYLELQWAPLPRMYGIPFHNDDFFASSESYPLAGMILRVPSPTDHFLLLLVHHGVADLWRKGRHFADIIAFYRVHAALLDLPFLSAILRQWKLERYVAAGLGACELASGLHIPLAEDHRTRMRDGKLLLDSLLRNPPIPKDKKDLRNFRRQLKLSGSLAARSKLVFGYARTWLSPSLIDLQQYRFPRPFFPLYFITKRLRFLKRK